MEIKKQAYLLPEKMLGKDLEYRDILYDAKGFFWLLSKEILFRWWPVKRKPQIFIKLPFKSADHFRKTTAFMLIKDMSVPAFCLINLLNKKTRVSKLLEDDVLFYRSGLLSIKLAYDEKSFKISDHNGKTLYLKKVQNDILFHNAMFLDYKDGFLYVNYTTGNSQKTTTSHFLKFDANFRIVSRLKIPPFDEKEFHREKHYNFGPENSILTYKIDGNSWKILVYPWP
ncbi:hypothetical protein ACFL35_19230 [Candidatus Riflebacteria bacterium]